MMKKRETAVVESNGFDVTIESYVYLDWYCGVSKPGRTIEIF